MRPVILHWFRYDLKTKALCGRDIPTNIQRTLVPGPVPVGKAVTHRECLECRCIAETERFERMGHFFDAAAV